MSDPGSFLTRWSRLKRATARQSTAQGPQQGDTRPVKPVDLASLPPLESITAATQVGLFLQAGVPEALSRAALRRAWTTDPAIRDFIGIAEYQWDFNAEDSLRGFGALLPSDYRGLLARALGSTPTEAAAVPREHLGVTAEPGQSDEASEHQATAIAAEPPAGDPFAAPQMEQSPAPVAPAAPIRRSHGGALPR